MGTLTVTVPGLRIASEMNARGHWSKRDRRKREQLTATMLALAPVASTTRQTLGGSPRLQITLSRVYAGRSREMDSDNAVSGCKHIRDCIARWLGRGDDPRSGIDWRYRQERGTSHAVRVEITPVADALADTG